MTETKPFVPIWEKAALTFEEASAYTGRGLYNGVIGSERF